jgi:O-antigen ligase
MPNSLSHRLGWKSLGQADNRFSDPQFIRTIAWTAFSVACALVIGAFVAEAKWTYLIAIAVLPFAAWWPIETALGMFALVLPFDAIAVAGQGDRATALTFFVGAAAASILLAAGLVSGRLHLPPRAGLWWSLFVLWCAISCLWALDPALALSRLPTAGAFLFLYLLSTSLRLTPNERRRVVILTVLGGCLGAAYVTRSFYHGVSFATTERASLVVGNQEADPNGFAASMLLPISLAMALFFSSQKRIGKGLAMLAAAGMSFCVFLTMSRGAALALIVIAAIYLRRMKMKKWRALIPVSLLLSLLLSLLAFVPASFFKRFGEAEATGGAGRTYIWTAGLELLKHYWLLGTGVNGFPVAYDLYAGFAPVFKGFSRASHNIYLGMWVELGITGFAFFLLAMRSQFREANRSRTEFDPFLVGSEAACWAVLVAGFFLDVVWRKFFWFSWILLAIATQIREKQVRVRS